MRCGIQKLRGALQRNTTNHEDPQSSPAIMRIRGYLNEQSVISIFAKRPRSDNSVSRSALCLALAHEYHVSRKAIRDIWNRRSWINLTDRFVDAAIEPESLLPSSDSESQPSAPSTGDSEPSSTPISTTGQDSPATEAPPNEEGTSLLDDIEKLDFSEHCHPFLGEWEYRMAKIAFMLEMSNRSATDQSSPALNFSPALACESAFDDLEKLETLDPIAPFLGEWDSAISKIDFSMVEAHDISHPSWLACPQESYPDVALPERHLECCQHSSQYVAPSYQVACSIEVCEDLHLRFQHSWDRTRCVTSHTDIPAARVDCIQWVGQVVGAQQV
jgi:hypothetical protein